MLRLIRGLSPRVEFALVILVAFGPFVVRSVSEVCFPHPTPPITDGHLLGLVVYEPVVLLVLCLFLRVRGWTLQRIGLGLPGPREVLLGFGLFVLIYGIVYVIAWITWSIVPRILLQAMQGVLVAPHLRLGIVVLASTVNPVFEEMLVSGYVVSALKGERHAWRAIHTSTAIRLAYHLYQGSRAAFTVIPVGLIFALFYARRGQLWPLIVAHALFDFTSLLPFIGK